ncbi:MAG: isochorismatase family protein, partial [Pseudorhodoferax sp.]
EAYMHGYSAWVPADCTAAESPEAKRRALRHMATVMKCSVRASTAGAAPSRAGRAGRVSAQRG